MPDKIFQSIYRKVTAKEKSMRLWVDYGIRWQETSVWVKVIPEKGSAESDFYKNVAFCSL